MAYLLRAESFTFTYMTVAPIIASPVEESASLPVDFTFPSCAAKWKAMEKNNDIKIDFFMVCESEFMNRFVVYVVVFAGFPWCASFVFHK